MYIAPQIFYIFSGSTGMQILLLQSLLPLNTHCNWGSDSWLIVMQSLYKSLRLDSAIESQVAN